jgi:hypothetical protein
MAIEVAELRKAIKAAGHTWKVRAVPKNEAHGLGNLPSDPKHIVLATKNAELFARKTLKLQPADGLELSDAGGPATDEAALPTRMDWRDRGVIGPVRDQRWCGSCVSFATTGLVSAMAGIELGARFLQLSESDQHFNSSHGPNCGGWNNPDALGQIKSRGVVTESALQYMSGFDNPPVGDPADVPDHLWIAHTRAIGDRDLRRFRITNYSGWTASFWGFPFDMRKYYLANVGPLVCGFTVYEDFDAYGGDVYKHVTGKVRGGHAVLVVGYDDAKQAWICRNSWGSAWAGPANPDGTGAGYFMIGYGQANIDNEPFYGATGVIAPPVSPLVTAVSRSKNKMDAFAAGTNRGTFTAAHETGDTAWRGWWGIAGGVVAPGTAIHAVSRSADKLDAFCVGTDGGTYTAAWQPGDKAWRGWWHIQGGVAAPNTSIHAVSRGTDMLDVFCVGTDHGVYTAAWQAGDTSWRGWWRIGSLKVAPGTTVYAVSRGGGKLDIFAVGEDFGIYTAAWEPGDKAWRGWWRVQGGVAAPNTSVFAVSRGKDKLDIFAVGTDHGIYTAAWQAGDTSWRGWWRIQGGIAAPNTSVYGVSRSTDKLDVFAIGTDHTVYTAAWQAGDTSWRGWWPVAGGIAAPGTSAFAISRDTDKLDVFVVGTDYGTYTTGWEPASPSWKPWTRIAGGVVAGG